MKVPIVDDSRDIRGWLSTALSAIANIEVVGAMGVLPTPRSCSRSANLTSWGATCSCIAVTAG